MIVMIMQGILLPAVHEEESFSFCMCNPPFFGSLQEAGCNPHTAYAGNGQSSMYPAQQLSLALLHKCFNVYFETPKQEREQYYAG